MVEKDTQIEYDALLKTKMHKEIDMPFREDPNASEDDLPKGKSARLEASADEPSDIVGIIPPDSPIRGNDEKSIQQGHPDSLIDQFFEKVIQHKLGDFKSENVAFILINHIVPTLPPFLKAIERLGRIAVILPKQSHKDGKITQRIHEHYIGRVAEDYVTREWLAQANNAVDFIQRYVLPSEKFIIIDIGGYFAAPMQVIATAECFKDRFLGVVEDTENGHQKYEKTLKAIGHAVCPLASVARCELKETEDYNVGKSIVEGAGIILRKDSHTMLERMKVIGVIGFGKIGKSIAEHLRQKNVREVIVYDQDEIRQMKASSLGFKVVNRSELFESSDMIFGATGCQSLLGFDFADLKDNVFIASCTSHEDEFDLAFLKGFSRISAESTDNIDKYYLNGKRVNLLYKGDAVNFVHGAVNGPYIYSVQAGLIVSAIGIIKGEIRQEDTLIEAERVKIYEIKRGEMANIARVWLENFESFHHEDKVLQNEELFSFLSKKKDVISRSEAYLQIAIHLQRGFPSASNLAAQIDFLYQMAYHFCTSRGGLSEEFKRMEKSLFASFPMLARKEWTPQERYTNCLQILPIFLEMGLPLVVLYCCEDDLLKQLTEDREKAEILLLKIKAFEKLGANKHMRRVFFSLSELSCFSEVQDMAVACFPGQERQSLMEAVDLAVTAPSRVLQA